MTETKSDLPGQGIATRPLHFIWILDTSASMAGEKIGALNFALRECLQPMRDTAKENANAQVLVRVVTFSSGARWHVEKETTVDDFQWADVKANGVTDAGQAMTLVAKQLKMPPMTDRALPPVLVLISDGYPTDNFEGGLKNLLSEPWGKRAVRIGIGVGSNTDVTMLKKFVDNDEIPVLEVKNSSALTTYIKWVSTAVVKSTSAPLSRPSGQGTGPAAPPPPPPVPPSPNVW